MEKIKGPTDPAPVKSRNVFRGVFILALIVKSIKRIPSKRKIKPKIAI